MNNDRPIINMAGQHERWLELIAGKVRACFNGLGDSNECYSTNGESDGCEEAGIAAGIPVFASALMGFGGAANIGVGSVGGDIQSSAETEAFTNLPAQLAGYLPSATHMGAVQPWWRENNLTSGNGRGYQLAANSAVGNSAALRGHWWCGTGPDWGGTLKVSMRLDEAPYTSHVSATKVLTGSAQTAWGLRRETLDINAGVAAADKPLLTCLFQPGQQVTAPVFVPFMCVERPGRTTGAMHTPIVFAPSQHLGTIKDTYKTGTPDAWKIAHMRAQEVLLGPSGFWVWRFDSGVNDQSGGRTPAQFVADVDALRSEILRISDAAGIGRERHLFMVKPTHPQNSATPDGKLEAFVNAAAVYAPGVPNVLVVNQHSSAYGGSAAWAARHDGGGAAHLKTTSAGYRSAWAVTWAALIAAARERARTIVAVRAVGSGAVR